MEGFSGRISQFGPYFKLSWVRPFLTFPNVLHLMSIKNSLHNDSLVKTWTHNSKAFSKIYQFGIFSAGLCHFEKTLLVLHFFSSVFLVYFDNKKGWRECGTKKTKQKKHFQMFGWPDLDQKNTFLRDGLGSSLKIWHWHQLPLVMAYKFYISVYKMVKPKFRKLLNQF